MLRCAALFNNLLFSRNMQNISILMWVIRKELFVKINATNMNTKTIYESIKLDCTEENLVRTAKCKNSSLSIITIYS